MTNQLLTSHEFDDLQLYVSFDILQGACKACIHSAKHLVAFLADSLHGWQPLSEDAADVSLPFSGTSVDSTPALTYFQRIQLCNRLVNFPCTSANNCCPHQVVFSIKSLMMANLLGLSLCTSTTSPTLTLAVIS